MLALQPTINERLELVRGLVHEGQHQVLKFVLNLWSDQVLHDYARQHDPEFNHKSYDSGMKLICEAICYFLKTDTRADGSDYSTWKTGTPFELKRALYDFHEMDDWRYERLFHFADAVLSSPNGYDIHDMYDSLGDSYNSDLLNWLASSTGRATLLERVEDDFGILRKHGSIFMAIMYAQRYEIEELDEAFGEALDDLEALLDD